MGGGLAGRRRSGSVAVSQLSPEASLAHAVGVLMESYQQHELKGKKK